MTEFESEQLQVPDESRQVVMLGPRQLIDDDGLREIGRWMVIDELRRLAKLARETNVNPDYFDLMDRADEIASS